MTLEDRLRDAYQAAARTVRPETIRPGVQYRRPGTTRGASRARGASRLRGASPARGASRLRGRLAPLAAAAAVAAVIGTAVAVPDLVGRAPATMTNPATEGTPPFIAELAGAGGSQLAIQQAGTRHVTALIAPPGAAFAWNAVTATSGSTFIASATTFADRSYTSALYRLTISATGKLSQFTPLSSGIPGEISVLTASQDGHRIAYAALLDNGGGLTTLNVISGTATRHWTVPLLDGPGRTGLLPDSLAFTADGGELGFIIEKVADTAGPVRADGSMWLLPVSSAPGSATARGHKVTAGPPGSAPMSMALSADGQTMYVLSMAAPVPYSEGPSRAESVTLSAHSTADGSLLRTVRTWTGIPATAATEPSMTIAGGQLLVWGLGGTTAYQVDPASGAAKPVWVYSLHDKNLSTDSSSIAW